MARHSLSAKDLTAREAVCSVCGPTAIRPNGPAKWICANKKKSAEAAWRAANPAKVRLSRDKKSKHHLTQKNPETRRGACPVCGPVDIVPFGRGWACSVRNAELGRSVQVEIPRCLVCGFCSTAANPVKDGRCGYHHPAQVRPLQLVNIEGEYTRSLTQVDLASYEAKAQKVSAKESAVPGWRMAGQNVPTDEWAKWNELLAREGL